MANSVARILLLLASSEMRTSDLREFSDWVARSKGDELQRRVLDLRRIASSSDVNSGYPAFVERQVSFSQRASGDVARGNLAEMVERILIHEAGLSKKHATEVLREQLEKQLGGARSIPSENKIAFATWIERLSTVVPGSQLIHLATKIRNSYVNSNKPDWPLAR